LAIVGPDKKIGLVTFDGQSLPLAQAPGTLYALAALSTDPAADSQAYAIGPAGVKELTFVNHSSDGFASFTGASAPQGEVAWDHWATNAVSGTFDSDIFLANTDGSGLHSVLNLTGDHVLHVVRFSPDGQSLYYSQEPLGLGGYIPFSGVSDLFVLDLASGASSQLVPDAAAGVICLDDFAPDASLVALHCNPKTIDVLDTTMGSIGQISAPAKVTDWQLHGDARLSPDQTRVAYALARGDPNNEQGWVAVSDSLSGTSHLVATAPAGEYYSVKGWLNDSTLVLQSWGTQPGVWVVQADGSDLRRLADGVFLGGG
jgi:Tol biopolymer transport system component